MRLVRIRSALLERPFALFVLGSVIVFNGVAAVDLSPALFMVYSQGLEIDLGPRVTRTLLAYNLWVPFSVGIFLACRRFQLSWRRSLGWVVHAGLNVVIVLVHIGFLTWSWFQLPHVTSISWEVLFVEQLLNWGPAEIASATGSSSLVYT